MSAFVVKSKPIPTPTPRVWVVDSEVDRGSASVGFWLLRTTKGPEYLYEFHVWWQLWRDAQLNVKTR